MIPADGRSLLITLTGRDRPGVTSRLFFELGRFGLVVLDAEQIVLRGRLILGVLVDLGGADATLELALRDGLAEAARDLGLEVEVSVGRDSDAMSGVAPLHVTVLGHELRAAAMASV